MARTNVYMSVANVTIKHGSGPTTISLTEVTGAEPIVTDTIAPWQADGHIFPTVMVRAAASRGVRLMGGDVSKMLLIPRNTVCLVEFDILDAKNQTASGSGTLHVALSNAIVTDTPSSNRSNQYSDGSVSFASYSSDGATDPLTVTEHA